MATVTETCADLIRRYPGAYENRTQVLHALFLVSGNGYRWVAGELVDPAGDRRTEEDADDSVVAALVDAHGPDHPVVASTRAVLAALTASHRERRDQADVLAVTPGPLKRPLYPYGTHCGLATMPEDVTDDWFDAAVEIIAAMAADLTENIENTDTPEDRR